jgi:hypothetical protein
LEKSLAAGNGKADAFNLFFLTMCYHHLGDAAKARACYDQALAWWQGKQDLPPPDAEDLKAFQTEAESVLGKPPPPLFSCARLPEW